jgi:hypothetical protein
MVLDFSSNALVIHFQNVPLRSFAILYKKAAALSRVIA